MRRVIIESPYASSQITELDDNIAYVRAALHDAFKRGEAPFASHALYTLPGVLLDSHPGERSLGIRAGFEWGGFAQLHAFYTDRGWSRGMLTALERCRILKYEIEFRSLTGKVQLPPDPNKAIEEKRT